MSERSQDVDSIEERLLRRATQYDDGDLSNTTTGLFREAAMFIATLREGLQRGGRLCDERRDALIAAKREMWMGARDAWTLEDFKNWAVIQQIDAALGNGPTSAAGKS